MNALIIGGHRHGEFVDVLDGAQAWVDIRTGTTHRIRPVTNTITNEAGKVIGVYLMHLAVHQDALGPEEAQIVTVALGTLAMNAFYREHGEELEIPKEPAASSLIIPGQPS